MLVGSWAARSSGSSASEVAGTERDRLWVTVTEGFTLYASYQRKAKRQIPLFVLAHAFSSAYDKRAGMTNVLYLVDSGRGSAGVVQAGRSTNGRVWQMVLDPADPTKVLSLSILIEGDDREVKDPARIHQPDNIESTVNGLYLTEDPGSQQNFPVGSIDPTSPNFDARATNARIWQYKLSNRSMTPVAVVDQSTDEGPGDVDPVPAGTHGFWEASGIVDASSVFGPGSFLVTVQAHSLWVDGGFVSDTLTRTGGVWSLGPDGFPDWVNKREGGQLVLLKIPGG